MNPLHPNAMTLASLQTADLLPEQFRQQLQLHRTIYAWSVLVLASGAIFVGTFAASWAQVKRKESDRTRLISDAAPLKQVRNDVMRMQGEVESLRTTCSLVESAKPSDELLQTFAVIAVALDDSGQKVIIDSINVRLPLEYPPRELAPPTWAEPEMSIVLTFPQESLADEWIDRVERSDRIENPAILNQEQLADAMRMTLTAIPLAITDVP